MYSRERRLEQGWATDVEWLLEMGLKPGELERYFSVDQSMSTMALEDLTPSQREFVDRLIGLGLAECIGDQFYLQDGLEVVARRLGRRPQVIHQAESEYQSLELCKLGEDVILFLNEVIQFHTAEQRDTHALMVTIPMLLSESIEHVVILGGGDGHAAREVLKFGQVKKVTQVELDPRMVEMTRNHPEMRRLTDDSFHDPRMDLRVGDALAFVLEELVECDVIIEDCELSFTEQPDSFDMNRFIEYQAALVEKLSPGGISCTMNNISPTTSEELAVLIPLMMEFHPELPVRVGECQSLEEALRVLYQTIAPHARHWPLRSYFLGTEFYTYLSKAPFQLRGRTIPEGMGVTPELLSRVVSGGRPWH